MARRFGRNLELLELRQGSDLRDRYIHWLLSLTGCGGQQASDEQGQEQAGHESTRNELWTENGKGRGSGIP